MTHRPDSFLTIFRRLSTTPYTNFASSSKGNPAPPPAPPPTALAFRLLPRVPINAPCAPLSNPDCTDCRLLVMPTVEKMLSRTPAARLAGVTLGFAPTVLME